MKFHQFGAENMGAMSAVRSISRLENFVLNYQLQVIKPNNRKLEDWLPKEETSPSFLRAADDRKTIIS